MNQKINQALKSAVLTEKPASVMTKLLLVKQTLLLSKQRILLLSDKKTLNS